MFVFQAKGENLNESIYKCAVKFPLKPGNQSTMLLSLSNCGQDRRCPLITGLPSGFFWAYRREPYHSSLFAIWEMPFSGRHFSLWNPSLSFCHHCAGSVLFTIIFHHIWQVLSKHFLWEWTKVQSFYVDNFPGRQKLKCLK